MPRVRAPELHALRLLKLIYERGQISRTELASLTGYSAFHVSKLCERLLAGDYIVESGSGQSTGGRRPTLLSLTPKLGRILGVHVGTLNARLVVTDIAGNQLAFLREPSRAQEGPDAALSHLIRLIERVLADAETKPGELLGIGLGISGILDRATGTTLFWPKAPQWVNVRVRDRIQEHFPTHIEVEDTPRTMALAERRLGLARDIDNFIYIMIGAGVGSALFFGGQLYTGRGGFAGEIGHVSLKDTGPLGVCGNRGSVETLVSAGALIGQAQEAMSRGVSTSLWHLCGGDPSRISVELIADAARAGDRFCMRLLSEAADYIGKAIVTMVQLLDPEQIVLGGGLVTAAGQMLLPVIRQVVDEHSLPLVRDPVQIQLSELREADWATGASLLVADKVLEDLFLSGSRAGTGSSRTRHAARGRRKRQQAL